MGGADNRVAANTDSGGEPNVGELEHHLVGEGTRLGDKTDLALSGDIRRSNTDQALLRGDNAGAVRPDNAGNLLAVLVHRSFAAAQNSAVSCTGTPSVMTTTRPILASIASSTAALVKAGGTKTIERSHRFGNSLGNGTENLQLNIGAVLCLVGNGGASLAGVHAAHNVRAGCEHTSGVLVPSPP